MDEQSRTSDPTDSAESATSSPPDEDLWALVREYKSLRVRRQELLADGEQDEDGYGSSDISQVSLVREQLECLAKLDGQMAADVCHVPGVTTSSAPAGQVEAFLDNIENIEVSKCDFLHPKSFCACLLYCPCSSYPLCCFPFPSCSVLEFFDGWQIWINWLFIVK